ncbi:MAG: hypothetical protein MUF84_20980 [Anaerolineae bacterium]|nr:hypothetical protein [Anaerolineae bacterium]
MTQYVVPVRRFRLLPVAVALAIAALGAFSLMAPARAVQALPAPPAPLTDWIIAVGNTGTVSLVDTATDIVYGPVISGGLGSSGGGLFDVAVVPGSNMVLISNFGDAAVYFVDFTDRMSPTIVTSVTLDFYAEDIDVAPDGRTAYVTDGGFSPMVAVIDVAARSLAYTVTLEAQAAQAVEVAPDGTLIVADYFGGALHTLYPDASGVLTWTGTYSYFLTVDGQVVMPGDVGLLSLSPASGVSDGASAALAGATGTEDVAPAAVAAPDVAVTPVRPVNVAIAPDGQTVIMANVGAYDTPTDTYHSIAVFRITAPGVISFTGAITNLLRSTQSVAFSADGTQVYLAQNGGIDRVWDVPLANALTILDIVAPGEVRLAVENAADYPRLVSSQLFGVDTIAVARGKAYLGNPSVYGAGDDLRVVDLSDFSVKRLTMPGIIAGVGVLSPIRTYLPLAAGGAR